VDEKRLPSIGKIGVEFFEQVIRSNLGAENENVILGPMIGVDAAVIDLGEGKIMVVKSDPTFGLPAILDYLGFAIVHIVASDVAVMGIPPKYMSICLLIPPGFNPNVLEKIWRQLSNEAKKLGIAIIGGHTGVYPGIPYLLNGGATIIGIGDKERLVTPTGAKPGDLVLITKGAAIEAAAVLAIQYPEPIERTYGSSILKRAQRLIWDMTVVKDALIAAEVGGVTAMHDATEGGVYNAIWEIAYASNVGIRVYEEKIPVLPEVKAVCDIFKIDPMISISEGTLIATVKPDYADEIRKAWKREGIESAIIGEVTELKEGKILVKKDGSKVKLKPVSKDPFWEAYFRGTK